MKIYPMFLTGLIVAGPLLYADEARLLDNAFFQQIRRDAASHHPAVLAAQQRAHAAQSDVSAVRLWDDPMVGIGFMQANRMMRADEGDVMLSLEQPLPKPGLQAAKRRKFDAMHRAELENASNAAELTSATAARAAIELALADESILLQQAQIDWLNVQVANARQLASNPTGSATDALRLESELVREQQMLEAARRNRDGYAQKLNLSLGRPLDAAWPRLKLPPQPIPVPLVQSEIARVPHASPKMRAMAEMTAAAAAETQIAEREKLPAISVGIDSRIYSDTRDVQSTTFGLKVTLPWWNDSSYQANIHAAASRKSAAEQDRDAMGREISAMVVSAVTEATNAAAQARAFQGEILEKAQASQQAIESAWISSNAPLADCLAATRELFAVRFEQRRLVAMQLAALEDLHALVPTH